jgi:hypothetical protein
MYQLIDNQALADLIGGRFPSLSESGTNDVHLVIPDGISLERGEIRNRFLRAIPTDGVERTLVDGASWNHGPEQRGGTERRSR